MTTPSYLGSMNGFIASATGQIVGFVRKENSYKLMEYCQLVKSTRVDGQGKPVCLYGVLDYDEPIRVVTDAEYAWEDGDKSPEGSNQDWNFIFNEVRMFRRAYAYRKGEQLVSAADIPVLAIDRQIAANKAMINKTARVWTMLENTSNWGSNTASANVLNGGRGMWPSASSTPGNPNYLAIKRSINSALLFINQQTNGIVGPDDGMLKLVLSPILAANVGQSEEITDYLKSGPYSKMVADGKERGRNSYYGCPDTYCGVDIVVENAMRDTNRPNAAGTYDTTGRGYIKSSNTACIMSQKGGLDGVEGSPSFSTVQIYYYKYEMAVEERFDSWNKLHEGRVVDQFKEVLAANRSGFLIQDAA